jgi:RNA polymerase sigma-70 factor (ECF subfamily)
MDEALLLRSLRSGDEGAFTWLIQKHHASLVRLAQSFVQEERLAEEIAQETWIAVLNGLNRFEGRSSLKTWIFTILTNQAKTRGQREKRMLSFSDLEDSLEYIPTVDPERFRPPNSETSPNHWITQPLSWDDIPEERFLSRELLQVVHEAIAALPGSQKTVITLHDIEGFSSDETCNILGISETNQRVLLHRARARVRTSLENYLNMEN